MIPIYPIFDGYRVGMKRSDRRERFHPGVGQVAQEPDPIGVSRRTLLQRAGLSVAGVGALGTGTAVMTPDLAAAAVVHRPTHTFAITFDDGPHAAELGTSVNRTERVLDVLCREGVRGPSSSRPG